MKRKYLHEIQQEKQRAEANLLKIENLQKLEKQLLENVQRMTMQSMKVQEKYDRFMSIKKIGGDLPEQK